MDPTIHGDVVRGTTAVSQGENISTLYIEDENGRSVDGHRLTEIRKLARKVWNKFADIGQAPPTWGKANVNFTTEYRREMRHHFPELRLCENDWKAELLATENYPSWYNNHHRNSKIKKEDGSSTQLDKKKKRSLNQNADDVDQAAKKQKTATALRDVATIDGTSSGARIVEINGEVATVGVVNLDDDDKPVDKPVESRTLKVCNLGMLVVRAAANITALLCAIKLSNPLS
jgi:hypothetical protein